MLIQNAAGVRMTIFWQRQIILKDTATEKSQLKNRENVSMGHRCPCTGKHEVDIMMDLKSGNSVQPTLMLQQTQYQIKFNIHKLRNL